MACPNKLSWLHEAISPTPVISGVHAGSAAVNPMLVDNP